MAFTFKTSMLETSVHFQTENVDIKPNVSVTSHLSANTSFKSQCKEVNFSAMAYMPWNNPDNIISADAEQIVSACKINILGFLFLIGVPANVINMAVFYKQGLKDRVNLCLFALSLTDGLYLVVMTVYYGDYLYFQFITTEKFGPLRTFLNNVNFLALGGLYSVSPVISTIIAVERCYCVLRPLKYSTLMRTRTVAAIIVVTYVTILGIYFIVAMRFRIGCIYDLDSGLLLTTALVGEFYKKYRDIINILDGFVLAAVLPLTVMTMVMTSTIITIVKLRQITAWRTGTSSSLSAKEAALTKMLVGNSILFLACVSPISVFRFMWLFIPDMSSGGRYLNFYLTTLWISEVMSYINASFNICVYYAMGSRYRETFWAICSRKKRQNEKSQRYWV